VRKRLRATLGFTTPSTRGGREGGVVTATSRDIITQHIYFQ